jgi:hypothetical protein
VSNSFGSPVVAQAGLVSTTAGSSSRHTISTANLPQDAEAASVGHLPQRPNDAPSTCLDVIQRTIQERGFSEKVARRMAEAQKPSTMAVYESKWQCFSNWCRQRDANPLQASIPLIADFFCELHEERSLAYKTIEGYKTAIGHMVKAFQGLELNKDPHLHSLFANFARDSSRQVHRLPKWNLAFVLQAMTQSPFEPLDEAPLNLLTLRTVFLFTLASGGRRSEIHALTRESFMRTEDWTSVTVSPALGFIAKTELAIKVLVSSSRLQYLHCPVLLVTT